MTNEPLQELSEREREILRLLATGASNKEIAQNLFISLNTVKVHLRNIFAKISVSSRTEAALYAIRTGLIQSPGAGVTAPTEAPLSPAELANTGPAETPAGAVPESAAAQPGPAATAPRPQGRRLSARGAAWLVGLSILLLGMLLIFRYDSIKTWAAQQTAAAGNAADASTPDAPIQWRALAPLPTPLTGLAACSEQAVIYVFGGATQNGAVSAGAYLFNSHINAWESLPDKPTPVRDAQAAMLGRKIYIPGGTATDGLPTSRMEIYDPLHNTWSEGVPLPEARAAYALAAFEGRLYLFGGWNGEQNTNTLFIFDPTLQAWQTGAPMPSARAHASAAVQGGSIFVMGGEKDPTTVLDTVEIYAPGLESSAWRVGPTLPSPRTGAAAITLAEAIYLIGGSTSGVNTPGVNTPDAATTSGMPTMILIANEMNWGLLDANIDQDRSGLAAVTIGPAIITLGGSRAGEPSDNVSRLQILYTVAVPLIIR